LQQQQQQLKRRFEVVWIGEEKQAAGLFDLAAVLVELENGKCQCMKGDILCVIPNKRQISTVARLEVH